jgi:hypothetical protein
MALIHIRRLIIQPNILDIKLCAVQILREREQVDNKKILVGIAALFLLAAALYLIVPPNYFGNGWMQAGFAAFCITLVFLLRRVSAKAGRSSTLSSTIFLGGRALVWIGLALIACSVLWLFATAAIFSSLVPSSMDSGASAKVVVIPFLGMAAAGLSLIIYRIFSRFL